MFEIIIRNLTHLKMVNPHNLLGYYISAPVQGETKEKKITHFEKVNWTKKTNFFFADFRGTAHLPTGRHFLNSLYTIPMTVWPYLTI